MKALKLSLVIMAAALLTIGLSGMAYAFHSGGVAECGGCHSMHSPAPAGQTLGYLLVGGDQSSTCLSCHEHAGDTGPSSYHVSTAVADMPAGTAPKQRTPGGDFGWLKKTYTFTVRGTSITEDGSTHGHNIIAADKGYAVDSTNATAPGGTMSSSDLGCNSCHDPHGKFRRLNDGSISNTGSAIIASGSYATSTNPSYAEPPASGTALGVYRLLAGSTYTTHGPTGNVITPGYTGVPAAKAPNTYNQTEATNQVRVAYGVKTGSGSATWGNWCGACHGKMHSTGNYVHPVDQGLGATIKANYDSYVKSGDLTGNNATSFNSLAPFATNSGDYGALAALAVSNVATSIGPGGTDQVMCLSCHRAHATGWPDMLRWNMEGEFMVYNSLYPGTDNAASSFARGRLAAETAAAYYDRPVTQFASYQRVFCNKCHAKD